MTSSLRRRLTVFCAVITALIVLAGWSAFTSWHDLGTLRKRFSNAQFESFRIAGQLQSNVFQVNSALLNYSASGAVRDWETAQRKSAELNTWIDRQRDLLTTAREKSVLTEIGTEYDHYLAVAEIIRRERGEHDVPTARQIHLFNDAAVRMFTLAGRLADAHGAALGDLLGESQRSLRRLEALFGAGFVLVVAVGAWGTSVLFRETITPLRRQLIESQTLAERHEKLSSLGVLAAGVAHEIRNPLTALKTRAFALRKKLAPGTPALRDAAIIDQEVDRLERVVGDFLLFARPRDPEPAAVAPQELLCEVRELLAPELAKNEIELAVEADANAPTFRADPHQLKQVLINLVRNAAESIGRKGHITLRSRRERLPLEGRLQAVIVLEVQDTGTGIPADVQERLFDPFFTTKAAGTGLGLSIAMRILERHGGTLLFQTAPGRGTTFGVVLPARSAGTGAIDGTDALDRRASGRFDSVATDQPRPLLDGGQPKLRVVA
jgi:signal transduction histidine kinase